MCLMAGLAGASPLALAACTSSGSSTAASSTSSSAGDTALGMIRPTGVKLCADGSDGHHLSGRVTDVAFRGRGYEHAIDVNGTTGMTGVFADVRAARGETVRLRLDPAGCHLFPAAQ